MTESPSPADQTEADGPANLASPLHWQIMNSLGIIAQLTRERNRRLVAAPLSPMLFGVLNHFHRLGGGHTVTDLARAFQVPQPGMTKSVQKLLDRGFLRIEPDPADARRKRLFITDAGTAVRDKVQQRMAPDFALVFQDWDFEDLNELAAHLYRLRRWLDENRDNLAPEP